MICTSNSHENINTVMQLSRVHCIYAKEFRQFMFIKPAEVVKLSNKQWIIKLQRNQGISEHIKGFLYNMIKHTMVYNLYSYFSIVNDFEIMWGR